MAAAFGGFNVINFTKQKIEIAPVVCDPKNLKELENSIFIFDDTRGGTIEISMNI